MFQRILVPLDGSARAEHAIPVAARLARAAGGTVVLARVVHPPVELGVYGAEPAIAQRPDAFEKHMTEAEHYLAHVTHVYVNDLAGVHVEQEVDTGAASPTIFSLARLERVDLIVLCSHGTHDLLHRVFFGSVAQEAARHSPVPVLVLNETGGAFLASGQGQPVRMLVTLDSSSLAETVLQRALQVVTALAAPAQGEVHLLRIVDLPSVDGKPLLQAYQIKHMQDEDCQKAEAYLQEVAHRLSEQTPMEARHAITWSVLISTHVGQTIARTAEDVDGAEPGGGYDIIAMATHGRSGLQRLALGSVTEYVLGATRLPLLIVPPPQIASKHEQVTEVEAESKAETQTF